MTIKKVSYKNEIMEVHYEVDKKSGKPDEYTVRSGDKPLPAFRNLLMKLRDSVVSLLELPQNDDEVKRITVNQVSFDYSGENNIMGAVISAKRALNHSSGVMVLNTPHKFAKTTSKSGKGNSAMVFDKPVISLLDELIEEVEKYVNGERAQGDLFKDQPGKVEVKTVIPGQGGDAEVKKVAKNLDKAAKKLRKPAKMDKKFHVNPHGPEEPGFAVKAKGKFLQISPGMAVKLTALASEDGVLQDSIHEGMKEIGYAGNKLLFEVDGGLLQIHSAVIDYKQMNNDSLAKNAIEELIQDFIDQPILRLRPLTNVDLTTVQAQATA